MNTIEFNQEIANKNYKDALVILKNSKQKWDLIKSLLRKYSQKDADKIIINLIDCGGKKELEKIYNLKIS